MNRTLNQRAVGSTPTRPTKSTTYEALSDKADFATAFATATKGHTDGSPTPLHLHRRRFSRLHVLEETTASLIRWLLSLRLRFTFENTSTRYHVMIAIYRRWPLPLVLLVLLLSGCISTPTLYPGTGQTSDLHESGVTILGTVTACSGAWCKKEGGGYESVLSLPAPPDAYAYQSALKKKATKVYGVPEPELVLGEISVGYYAELIGTIRGWEATCQVGRKGGLAQEPVKNNLASPYYSP